MKHALRSSLHATLFLVGLAALALGCSSEPSVETLATNMCVCTERDEEEPWTDAVKAACRTTFTDLLAAKSDACLECLDDSIGDTTTAAACAAANACEASCGGGDQ